MGSGGAGVFGLLIGVPLALASIAAMIAGFIYAIILFRHWPLAVLSVLSLFFVIEVITEFGPVLFYNLVPVVYGVITLIFALAWFAKYRKELA